MRKGRTWSFDRGMLIVELLIRKSLKKKKYGCNFLSSPDDMGCIPMKSIM